MFLASALAIMWLINYWMAGSFGLSGEDADWLLRFAALKRFYDFLILFGVLMPAFRWAYRKLSSPTHSFWRDGMV